MRSILLATLLLTTPLHAANDSAELKRITNELLAAIAPGNVAVWQKYAHDRLIYSTEANEVFTKAKLLEELKPLPKGPVGHIEVGDDWKVEVHGNVAVTTNSASERLEYHGQLLESQFRITDTWIKTKDGWRLIASQVLAVLVDPPAIALPREAVCAYNGTYRLTDEILTTLACTDDGLLRSERTGRPAVTQKAEVLDVFFTPGQPRTRRIFLRNERGEITGFADRREGHDIVWHKVIGVRRP